MAKRPIIGNRARSDADKLEAIAPLVNVRRTEEMIAARAAEVGVSSRTLHRWIADFEGRSPGDTKLRFDFPAAALFVAAEHFKGSNARTIHQFLKSQWADLYPGKPCVSYSTLLCYIRSLPPVTPEKKEVRP
jgi:hypothetical protein